MARGFRHRARRPARPGQVRSICRPVGMCPRWPFLWRWTLQSAGRDIARVRLVWDDGYQLEDDVENGIVLFLGVRDRLDRAMVEFLDQAECVVANQTL